MQKKELAETRMLLEVSTNAQNDQIKLAALTALLNSNLTQISILEAEMISVNQTRPSQPMLGIFDKSTNESSRIKSAHESANARNKEIKNKIDCLIVKNNDFKAEIESYLRK